MPGCSEPEAHCARTTEEREALLSSFNKAIGLIFKIKRIHIMTDFKKWTKPKVRNLGVISSFRYHLKDTEEGQCKLKVNRKRT